MAAELGKAYVNIVPKADGISRKVEGLLDGRGIGDSTGKKLGGGIVSGLKKIAIGAALGKVLKDAFASGGDLQQSFGGLETIYGDAAEAAKKYAESAALAGISANSHAEQAVSFGAALKQAYGGDTTAAMEAANMAILDMTDNAAKMGTPLESLQQAYQGFAKQNYTMLDNLKLGYGGTQAEMQRLLADAEKISGVKYDISNLGDVYNAIHVIQGELGLTGVAAEEAKTTLTGSFNAVKASWTNVMAALTTGRGLDTAMQNLTESVGFFTDNVLKMLSALGPQVPTLIFGVLQALISNAPALLMGGLEMAAQIAIGLVNGIPDLIGKIPEIWEGIKEAWAEINWSELGSAIINGTLGGIAEKAYLIYNRMKEIAMKALEDAKAALGIGASQVGPYDAGGGEGGGDAGGATQQSVSGVGYIGASSLNFLQRAQSFGAMPPKQSQSIDIDMLLEAASHRPIGITVVLQGDARQLFKVVKAENDKQTKATNYNALARA